MNGVQMFTCENHPDAIVVYIRKYGQGAVCPICECLGGLKEKIGDLEITLAYERESNA